MLPLLLAWPVVALLVAATDTFLTRLELPHRPVEALLFGQTLLLWMGFGLLALVPASACSLLFRSRPARLVDGALEPARLGPGRAIGLQLFWTLIPAVVHGVLDRHTAIGADITALLAPEPWLQSAVAALVLALGCVVVGWVVGLLGARRPRLIALGVGAVGLASFFGFFLPWHTGAGASAHADGGDGPSSVEGLASGADRPNVLLLVWDTTRAHSVSAYGRARETTPALAGMKDEALLFQEARSATVFTFSSHLTMLTGQFPAQHGGRLTHMVHDPARGESVARTLHKAGYRTGAFVGTSVLAAHTGIHDGFEVYDDQVDPPVCDTAAWAMVHDVQSVLAGSFARFHANGRPHGMQDFQRPAGEVLARAAAWIANDDPRPWFCMINLYDVHWPYLPEGPGRELIRPYAGPMNGFGSRADGMRGRDYEPNDADEQHLTDLYEAELLDLDIAVAGFLEGLDLGAGGTGVLITSDHGEAFGEAGVWEHDDIFEPQVRIPFVVRLPEPAPVGEVITEPVSGIDVAPTLLGLAGLEGSFLGLDLTRERPDRKRTTVVQDRDGLTADHDRVALYSGRWKLERRGAPGARTWGLFDLTVDPVGEFDLGTVYPEQVEVLRAELDAWEAQVGVEELGGDAGALTRDALRALGYLED